MSESLAPPARPAEAMSALHPGRALFSTELGERLPRQAPGPPHPPVVVRSGPKMAAVAETAMYWRNKFPCQAMAILPGCGWNIEDFWDAKDIQMDTREHYMAALEFLSEQNVVWARTFATEWFQAHPEQAAKTVGLSSMASICDPTNPQDIVDKVFIYGESEKHPPAFLWQAALTMRTTMLEVRAEQKKSNSPEGTKMAATALTAKATSKTNRKITRSRPQRLTASTEPSPAVTYSVPTPAEPLAAPSTQHGAHPPKRAPSYGPPPTGTITHHGQAMGAIMAHMPPFAMAPVNTSTPPLYNSRLLSGGYSENRSLGNSGVYASRAPSGTLSNTHSPHFNNAPIAMGLPGVIPQHPGQYVHMSPASYPAQAYHPGVAHPSMVLPGMHVPGSNMPPGYTQQGFNDRTPRGMGDMTNHAHYPHSIPPQAMGMQQHGNRRNSIYGNGNGSLYDPYNGTNPAFNEVKFNKKTDR